MAKDKSAKDKASKNTSRSEVTIQADGGPAGVVSGELAPAAGGTERAVPAAVGELVDVGSLTAKAFAALAPAVELSEAPRKLTASALADAGVARSAATALAAAQAVTQAPQLSRLIERTAVASKTSFVASTYAEAASRAVWDVSKLVELGGVQCKAVRDALGVGTVDVSGLLGSLPDVTSALFTANRAAGITFAHTEQARKAAAQAAALSKFVDVPSVRTVTGRVAFFDSALSQQYSTAAVRHALEVLEPARTEAQAVANANSEVRSVMDPALDLLGKGLPSNLLGDLQARATLNADLAVLNTDLMGSTRSYATRPALAYETYVGSFLGNPTRHGATFARTSGAGLSGLAAADALRASDTTDRDDVLEYVEGVVLEPWEQTASESRTDLYRLLDLRLPGAGVAEMLRGAWDGIGHRGPAQVEKVAHCIVEAIDRALRGGAPEREVMQWLDDLSGGGQLLHNGRPTRTARIRFIMATRPKERQVVETQVDSLVAVANALNSAMQSSKHASTGSVLQVRTYLMTAEAVLSALFTDE